MSDERRQDSIDPLVSDTYRDLADEQTPDALTDKVLRMAAREGRTRYSILRAWTRPLAWAATIGLSLTLVLQLTETPQPDAIDAPRSDAIDTPRPGSAAAPQPVDASRTEQREVLREAAEPALSKRSRAEMQQGAEKISVAPDEPEIDALEDSDSVAVAPVRALAPRDTPTDAEEDVRSQAGAAAKQEIMPEAAAERQIERSEDRAAAAVGLASYTDDAASQGDYLCPASERETAEKWLDCIDALETSVPGELVDREYRALRKSFPEFEHPAADR